MKRLKNFFKKNLKVIIIFIVSMIITSMVSVYAAYNYLSTDVSYTKADGTTVSVADALNELYKNKTSSSSSSISIGTNYTGYFADTNDDGRVDGVIFIDLAKGASGTGLGQSYSYSAVTSGLKGYKISTKTSSYTDSAFGTHPVLVRTSNGADRFYVMSLVDCSGTYKWSAACNLSQNEGVRFRLPSMTEWAAFAGQVGITSSNYSSTYGLNGIYWTSTEYGSNNAWRTSFSDGRFSYYNEGNALYARLCATF